MVAEHIPENAYAEQWDIERAARRVLRSLALDLPLAEWAKEEGIADEEIRERLLEAADRKMAEKAAQLRRAD